ncbi:AAA family ATPase [uncultured Jatrophihabitans sp.]|uniref:bifunctional aminoglycoside phosphotransferase/ATP-binding protein n=1 Tax=uncultured Jatrophihabitans sp. TaxID=1610747 RepID=UPI0035C99B8D
MHETHSGVVILLGDLAYKIKKPVDLGFLDFRSHDARTLACQNELRLNRRLARDVYLDVGGFSRSLDTTSEPVLVMRRMPDDRRLSTLILDGADVAGDLRLLARRMADFHAGAARGPAISAAAGAAALARRWDDNLREVVPYAGTVLDDGVLKRVRRAVTRFLDGRTVLLNERAAGGFAVDGHGDLIADDVFCLDDGPRILDCLEFDDALRWVDVLDDMAFLAMDLEFLGRADLAGQLLDAYAEFSAAPIVEALRHHYIAYRAFVRAKVACIRAAQGDPDAARDAVQLADLALRHLETGEVRLILVGGAPGTGKTTVATALADRLGATYLSTEVIRGEHNGPDTDRYTKEAKTATYRAVLERARHLLERGQSVVADATWGELAWRREAGELATTTASMLTQLVCEAPVDVAAARAEQRLRTGYSPSQAGGEIARTLATHRDPWPDAIRIDTSGTAEGAIARAVGVTARRR